MVRFGRLLLFALVTLWLPATMHCRLEAAGFFEAHDDCGSESAASAATDCKDDACPTVEQALFKESAASLTIDAPAEAHLPGALALRLFFDAYAIVPALSPAHQLEPAELRVAWQFITRAAPPARAPSLIA